MSQDKYLKYKNKYLALRKQFKQIGGNFRIGIKITDNARIRFGEALTEIIGASNDFQIMSDEPVAQKLLEFCKNNDVTIQEIRKSPIADKSNFTWASARYTIDSTPVASASVQAPSAMMQPSAAASVVASSVAAASAAAASAAPVIDLKSELDEREHRALEVFRCDAELALVTSNGIPIETVFDTGNAASTQIGRSIIEDLRSKGYPIDIIPIEASTSNILSFNSIIDSIPGANEKLKIEPIVQRVERHRGLANLAIINKRECERALEMKYEHTTLVTLHQRLHSLGIDKEKLEMSIDMIGFPQAVGLGGAKTLQLHQAEVPFELHTQEGNMIHFIVKAIVVDNLDLLLLSHDDILKMTIRSGIIVNFTDAGLASKIRMINLKKDLTRLDQEIRLLLKLTESRNNDNAYEQMECKMAEYKAKVDTLQQLKKRKFKLEQIVRK